MLNGQVKSEDVMAVMPAVIKWDWVMISADNGHPHYRFWVKTNKLWVAVLGQLEHSCPYLSFSKGDNDKIVLDTSRGADRVRRMCYPSVSKTDVRVQSLNLGERRNIERRGDKYVIAL